MIFEHEASSRRIVANVPNGATVDRYQCEIDVCHNPVCECRTLHITLIPRENQDKLALRERKISIDLEGRQVAPDLKKIAPPEQLNFCEALIQQMDEGDYTLLLGMYFHHKNYITEKELKPRNIDAKFDFDEIEKNASMLPYNHVLPFGDQILVDIDGVRHMLFDIYCVRAGCDCTDACIEFAPYTKDGHWTETETVAILNVDYRSREWSNAEFEISQKDRERLKNLTENKIPDFYAKLAKRHSKMKSIYNHCRKRYLEASAELLPPEFLPPSKIGRNDPCPCGSGKKYKKCCMK
jgi:hypothetical protein